MLAAGGLDPVVARRDLGEGPVTQPEQTVDVCRQQAICGGKSQEVQP